jgi:GTPase involved in cell partitioning and DNA repair
MLKTVLEFILFPCDRVSKKDPGKLLIVVNKIDLLSQSAPQDSFTKKTNKRNQVKSPIQKDEETETNIAAVEEVFGVLESDENAEHNVPLSEEELRSRWKTFLPTAGTPMSMFLLQYGPQGLRIASM